mgnify:CR=1 FL=1
MNNRFTIVYRTPKNLYTKRSPVLIKAGAILRDNTTGSAIAQIKICNLSSRTISACKVSINMFDVTGKKIKTTKEFTYLDLNVMCGMDFGTKVPILLQDSTIRKIDVSVKNVVFSNGDVWRCEQGNWKAIPLQATVFEKLSDPEKVKQYEMDVGENRTFYPEIQDGLFLCTCGEINLAESECCRRCGRKYENLINALDDSVLKDHIEKRFKAEQEKIKNEKIAKQKREKNIKIFLIVTVCSILLFCTGLSLYNSVILPHIVKKKEIETLQTAQVGDVVKFGFYEQDNKKSNGEEPLEWYVLAEEDGKALLLSKYGIQFRWADRDYWSWDTSNSREWLNNEFFNDAFDNEEMKYICNAVGDGLDGTDKVFVLSRTECEEYITSMEVYDCEPIVCEKIKYSSYDMSADNTYRIAQIKYHWFLRSTINGISTIAQWENGFKKEIVDRGRTTYLLRPAIWVNIR